MLNEKEFVTCFFCDQRHPQWSTVGISNLSICTSCYFVKGVSKIPEVCIQNITKKIEEALEEQLFNALEKEIENE